MKLVLIDDLTDSKQIESSLDYVHRLVSVIDTTLRVEM